METFAALQARLGAAWAASQPGSTVPHAVVALPSFGVGGVTLRHYGARLTALEHRFLHSAFMLRSSPGCRFVLVTAQHPGPAVLDYYASVAAPHDPQSFLSRLEVLEVPEATPRSITLKLLERPDLVARLRDLVGDRSAMIEPWNVMEPEVALATRIGVPINGSAPELWPLGFKSAGRRLFKQVGVPVPAGQEGVRTRAEALAALTGLQRARPGATAALVKLDNSSSGDGNVMVALRDRAGAAIARTGLREALARLPRWYVEDLADGGVVEEFVTGEEHASPSVQADITPDGEVLVRSTHEQVLGGDSGQTYLGCVFPANRAYAAELGEHALAVGRELAKQGAVGRFALDFMAVRDGTWHLHALEVNLRRGGTSHPAAALDHLVPGRYEPGAGWVRPDGSTRCYTSTDNLVDPGWVGLAPTAVVAAVAAEGLGFDHARATGVVLHSLSGLAIDGRIGFTAFGENPEEADRLAAAVAGAVDRAAAAGPTPAVAAGT